MSVEKSTLNINVYVNDDKREFEIKKSPDVIGILIDINKPSTNSTINSSTRATAEGTNGPVSSYTLTRIDNGDNVVLEGEATLFRSFTIHGRYIYADKQARRRRTSWNIDLGFLAAGTYALVVTGEDYSSSSVVFNVV